MPARPRRRLPSAWTDDAQHRAQLRAKAIPLRASPRAESRYVLDLQALMRAVEKAVLHIVARESAAAAPAVDPDLHHDAGAFSGIRRKLAALFEQMRPWLRIHAAAAFDRMAKEVDARSLVGLALHSIRPGHVPGLQRLIDESRRENVNLITKATQGFLDQVRGTVEQYADLPAGRRPAGPKRLADLEAGAEPRTLTEALQVRAGVAGSRAALIARDQTLKLNAAVSQQRQRAVGGKSYRWSSSLDERVRPFHAALEGKVISWDDPPVTDDDGNRNHAGEDYQCRCVAVPIIEELYEPSTSESEESQEPE